LRYLIFTILNYSYYVAYAIFLLLLDLSSISIINFELVNNEFIKSSNIETLIIGKCYSVIITRTFYYIILIILIM